MNNKNILEWGLSDTGLMPTSNTVKIIDEWNASHKKGDRLECKILSKKESRSNKQHKRYWSIVLVVIADHVPGLDKYVDCIEQKNGSIRFDYKKLHRYLTLNFAVQNNHPEIIEYIPTVFDCNEIIVPIVSESFGKMSQKTSNEYFDFCEKLVFGSTGKTIDECWMER